MNDKSNSGKTILEALAFLAILVLLTFGGIHIFFSIYDTTIVKNLTEDVIRRTVAKQHATLAVHSQKQATSIVNAIGPHNIPVSEEDGVYDPYKDFFWITLGNVDYKVSARICAKLLEKQEILKQLKLVGVFINNRAIKNCPEEGAEVKYFFSKKDDLTNVPVIKIAECEDEILCPPHAICADAQISCIPGYNKAARGTCDEHCVPCGLRQLCQGGVEPTNPTECPIGQKPSLKCVCCETSDSAELCGCSKPNGKCDCNCESNEDCPSNYVCSPDDNICIPHCLNNPCGDDEICNEGTGLCDSGCTITGCGTGYICDLETQKCTPKPCATSNDCDDDYICNPNDNTCIPNCLIHNECDDGQICDATTKLCIPNCPEGNRILVNEHYICADCGEHAAYNMENNVCKCETGYSGADFVLGAINTCCLSDKAAINNGQQTCCADDEEPSGAENAQICCPIGKMNIEGICVSSDCAAQWCIVATSMLGGTECSSSDSQFKKCTVNGSSLTCTSSISLENGIADLSQCDVTIAKGTSLTLDGVQSKVKSLTLASATATVNSSTLKITDDLVQETDTYRTMTVSNNSSVTVGGDTYANLTKPSSTNYWKLDITDSTFSTNEITVSTESTSSARSLRLNASNSQIKATDIKGRVKITLKSNSSFEASSLCTGIEISATDSTMKIEGNLEIKHLSDAETYTINQSEFKNSELTVDGYMYSLGDYKHEIGSSTIKGNLIVKNLDLINTSLTAESLTAAYPITTSSSSYGHVNVTESSVINIEEKITVDNGQLKLTKSELNAGEISMLNGNNLNIQLQNSKVNVTGPITGNTTIGSHDSALDALSVHVASGITGYNSTINIKGDVVFDDKWTPGKMQGLGFYLSDSTVEVMGNVNSHLPYKQTGGSTTIHGYLNPRVISIYKGSLWAGSINIKHPENDKPLNGYICASGPSDCTKTANTGIYIFGDNSPVTVAGNLHSYEEVYVGATASLSVEGEFTLDPKPNATSCLFVISNAYDSSLYNFIGKKCNFNCNTTKINIAANVEATKLSAHNASNITIGGDVLLSDILSVGHTNNDVPSSLSVGGNVDTKDSRAFSSASVVVKGDVSASNSFEVEGDATFLTNNINTKDLSASYCGEICAKDITVSNEFLYADSCKCSVVNAHSISVGGEFRYYCSSPNSRVNPWPNAQNTVDKTCSVEEPCVQKLDCPY